MTDYGIVFESRMKKLDTFIFIKLFYKTLQNDKFEAKVPLGVTSNRTVPRSTFFLVSQQKKNTYLSNILKYSGPI